MNVEQQRRQAGLKRNLKALGITLLLHAFLLGMLLWFTVRANVPEKPQIPELVLINAGNVDLSAGEIEPLGSLQEPQDVAPREAVPNPPQPQPAPAPETMPKTKKLITQNNSNQISAAELEAAKRKKEEERQRVLEEERKRKEREEQEKRERIRREVGSNVAGAFNGQKTNSGNQGTGMEAKGNQGVPGGSGDSYSLDGRTIITNGGYPTRPNNVKAIRGKIRVRIVVNNLGQVTDAWVEPQGTQISDPDMRNAAVKAAKATRFNKIPGGTDQRGIITYLFDVQ